MSEQDKPTEVERETVGRMVDAVLVPVEPKRPAPPARLEREPEPEPTTAVDKLIRLIAV